MSETADSPPEEGIPFTLNGEAAVAAPGETVLSVAKRLGIDIPTLCHHDALTPQGSCRLCVVEVSWGKRSKLVTSCIYIPYENDSVETDSDRVHRVRAAVLDLLWSRHPEVEVLRDLAGEYGIEQPSYSVDEASRSDRCILCGLCVRACAELVGQHAIGFSSRGMERTMGTPFGDQADECIGCAACVFVCPTGALHFEDADGRRVMQELNTEVALSTCRACGGGFAPDLQIAKIRQRLSLPDELTDTCPLCRAKEHGRAVEKALAPGGPKKPGT